MSCSAQNPTTATPEQQTATEETADQIHTLDDQNLKGFRVSLKNRVEANRSRIQSNFHVESQRQTIRSYHVSSFSTVWVENCCGEDDYSRLGGNSLTPSSDRHRHDGALHRRFLRRRRQQQRRLLLLQYVCGNELGQRPRISILLGLPTPTPPSRPTSRS